MMECSYAHGKRRKFPPPFSLSFHLLLLCQINFISPVAAKSKVHIVYIGEAQHDDPHLITQSHHQMLVSLLGSEEAAVESMVYSYRHGFSGFAAKLSDSQLEEIAGLPEVVHVVPNHFYNLKTTRSWDYLGLHSTSSVDNLLHKTNKGNGVIVGVFDTGIWPETEQLNDAGLGPIPLHWRGKCVSGERFDAKTHCNRKLIGAKWFSDGLIAEYGNILNNSESLPEFVSARDAIGHGTHTATTAAGSSVTNTSFKGLARGTARGGAPQARIAVYKVCWNVPSPAQGCTAADLLKAFDEAIYDGVDLLSLSLGGEVPVFSDVDPRDGITLGSFRAVARGIPVVVAAGNDGPHAQTVVNTSPWVLTVAATTMDRMFPTKITLGNNVTILGQSLYTGKQIDFTSLLHLETPIGTVSNSYCENLSFENISATGKVVLCFSKDNGAAAGAIAEHHVQSAGGVAVIVAKNPTNLFHDARAEFPVVTVDYEIGTQILFFFRSSRNPMVKIRPAKTLVGKPVATKVAHFSSRGPSSIAPAILKPDIAAPGVSILASSSIFDSSSIGGFGMQSGTSMATPHVAGIVALLKTLHPNWSPAAIKSAIITTGTKTDPSGELIFAEGTPKKLADPFDYGGGLVNPEKAADPGLVYDMNTEDYFHYLCSLDYSDSSISLFIGHARTCPEPRPSILDVNVPSITIPNLRKSVTLTRKVTNVGAVNSTYKALIEPPDGVKLNVKPKKLVFNAKSNTLTFKLTVSTTHKVNSGYYFGRLIWTDGVHNVASPISVRTRILNLYADDY